MNRGVCFQFNQNHPLTISIKRVPPNLKFDFISFLPIPHHKTTSGCPTHPLFFPNAVIDGGKSNTFPQRNSWVTSTPQSLVKHGLFLEGMGGIGNMPRKPYSLLNFFSLQSLSSFNKLNYQFTPTRKLSLKSSHYFATLLLTISFTCC